MTHVISKYLDRHLVIPLLEFLQGKDIYVPEELTKAKLDLLKETNMVDFAMDIHKDLYPDMEVPEAMLEKRSTVLERFKQLGGDSKPIIEMFTHEDVLQQIEDKIHQPEVLFGYLEENHSFKPEMLDTLYECAKFHFDCGAYQASREYLTNFRALSQNGEKNISALWGKLSAEILVRDWDAALEDVRLLKEYIDAKSDAPPLQQLQQRAWLIHWSLFIFFFRPEGMDEIIDLFLYDQQYSNTIQTICPHVLRYLTTAVITNKRRRNVLKDLVKIIQQESYTYRDPVTEFLECLYVNFDFDKAQQKLRQCEAVLANDFFLVSQQDAFIENARLFIFETYCRIHNTISISMLAEKLNMVSDKAEEWIVNLIRNARLDAKIDSQEGHVVMATQVPSIYHQVIEKTKDLPLRSRLMSENIDKRARGRGPGQRGGDRGDRGGKDRGGKDRGGKDRGGKDGKKNYDKK